jgi:branched-subunit amino acid aminotransferase/4-amino-4-deoxychorismate lyase
MSRSSKLRPVSSASASTALRAKQQASEAGVAEAFMVEDGVVTEGSSSTVFIVTKGGALVTRPLSHAAQVWHGDRPRAGLGHRVVHDGFLLREHQHGRGHPMAETGARAITVPDLRWKRRDIKSVALLAQVLAKQQASEMDFSCVNISTVGATSPFGNEKSRSATPRVTWI